MIYGKGLSHSEAQDRGENYSIGAVQMKKFHFLRFSQGICRGRRLSGCQGFSSLCSLLSQTYLGWKKKLELGLCPSPAPARATPGEEKGAWGDFLAFPGAAQEGKIHGMEKQGDPGWKGWQGEFIQENSPGGFIQNSSRVIYPGGWDGTWKRGETPKESY